MKPLSITAADLSQTLTRLAQDMQAEKDYLSKLDAAIGDGDMGVSIASGFRAVRATLGDIGDSSQDIGEMLQKAGLAFSDAAGATIGALFSIALLRAGKLAKGTSEIGLADILSLVRTAEDGIRERGKADVGNKTLLDALVPVRLTLEVAIKESWPTEKIASEVLNASEQGMLSTIPMKSMFGRGRWMAERTVGHQDPGATAVYLIVKSLLRR